MAGKRYPGPWGSDTNSPFIDSGTNSRTQSPPPGSIGAEIRAVPISSLEAKWIRTKLWFSELDDALSMFTWYLVGAPAFGNKTGDLEYGQMDVETLHIRNTPAYQEAEELYREWIKNRKPTGVFRFKGTEGRYVIGHDYFYVKGRSGAGTSPRGHFTEPLEHPLWAYTGEFSIRFTDTAYPKDGYVEVEIENYTSLPSYLHGISKGFGDSFQRFLDGLYTKRSGIPIVSRSRQVYRFRIYIPKTKEPASQQPGSGDKVQK